MLSLENPAIWTVKLAPPDEQGLWKLSCACSREPGFGGSAEDDLQKVGRSRKCDVHAAETLLIQQEGDSTEKQRCCVHGTELMPIAARAGLLQKQKSRWKKKQKAKVACSIR